MLTQGGEESGLRGSDSIYLAGGKLLEECDETGLGYRWEGDQLQGLESHEPWQVDTPLPLIPPPPYVPTCQYLTKDQCLS